MMTIGRKQTQAAYLCYSNELYAVLRGTTVFGELLRSLLPVNESGHRLSNLLEKSDWMNAVTGVLVFDDTAQDAGLAAAAFDGTDPIIERRGCWSQRTRLCRARCIT